MRKQALPKPEPLGTRGAHCCPTPTKSNRRTCNGDLRVRQTVNLQCPTPGLRGWGPPRLKRRESRAQTRGAGHSCELSALGSPGRQQSRCSTRSSRRAQGPEDVQSSAVHRSLTQDGSQLSPSSQDAQ